MLEEFTDIANLASEQEHVAIKPTDTAANNDRTIEDKEEEENDAKNQERDGDENIPSVFFNCTQQLKLKAKLMQLVNTLSVFINISIIV